MENNCKPSCDNCFVEAPIEFEQSIGYTGAKLLQVGWIYKNAILFTHKNSRLCFCSIECKNKYYEEVLKVTPEQSKNIKEWSDKCKEDFVKNDIPKIQAGMQAIIEIFNKKNK